MPNIPLNQAQEMIMLYTEQKALILKTEINPDALSLSETFVRADIDNILKQDGCVSFRIYYGMSADLNTHAILVGVDSEGNDILAASGPVIIEEGIRCPPICKPAAGLNG